MATITTSNSFVTLDEADAYFANRLNVALWDSSSDDTKQAALITATLILNGLNWTGTAVSSSQPLSFPRTGSYLDTSKNFAVQFPTSTTSNKTGAPEAVKRATYELAWNLINNQGVLTPKGSVGRVSVDVIELQDIKSASRFPNEVKQLIKDLLIGRGGNQVFVGG